VQLELDCNENNKVLAVPAFCLPVLGPSRRSKLPSKTRKSQKPERGMGRQRFVLRINSSNSRNIGRKIVKKYVGNRTTGRIFDSNKGTPRGDINRYALRPLLKKLGIPPATTTHAFRHGRVSILQQNRVPGDLIKEWVGHTSLRITSKYTHFDDAYRQGIIKNLK